MLVGSLPIEPEQFERGAVLEMLRMVREVDPPRPSTRLSSAQKLPSIAANRDIEPAVLAKLLSGELDWVVMKALEKDRTRRYESVIALAEDLQNYLSHEVVKARPPSRYYRLRKFVRRHRGAVFASLLVLLAVLTGMIGVVIQWREAVFERDQKEIARAQAVSERDLKEIARAEAIKNARVAMEQRRLALDTMGEIILHARSEMAPRQELQGAVRTLLQIARKSLDRVAQNPDVEVSLNDTTLALIHDMEARAARDAKDLPAAIKEFSQAASIFQSIINRANDGLEKDVLIKNLVVVLLGRGFVNLMSSNQALAYADFLQAAKVLDTVKDKSARDYYNLLVSVYTNIGIVTIDKNPRLAREHYRGMLKVKEGLSRQEAVDGKAITEDTRRDLIKLLLLVGNGEHRTRNADAADMIYTKAIADAEAWLASKPDDKLRKNLLANALERRGDLRLRTGKAVDAASDYAAAAGHFLAITTADAMNEDARADLSRIRYSQGLAAISANNKPRAAELFQESLAIRRARTNLETILPGKKDSMMSLARTGSHAEATQIAEVVRSKLATDPGSLVDVANCYAVCAAYLLATGNDKVTQERYTKQAIEAIRQAIAIGYGDKVNLETEPDLDGVRNQPEFRKLLESMREP